tara:strand:- start:1786 stop:2691 length:906 start_codon:yes stop_codon:yes gene_type:complete
MKKITAKYHLTQRETKELEGKFIDSSHYDQVVDYDCDVYTEDNRPLIFFRKNYIPEQILYDAYKSMETAAAPSSNRGSASGGERKKRKLKDGTFSKITETFVPGTFEPLEVKSGIAGYFDRSAHFDFCRTTAFNKKHFDKFEKAIPLIEFVDKAFEELVPKQYEKQKGMVKATHPNFRIKDTAFTTITINKDYRTAVHTDDGDYSEGFGNLVAYCKDIEPALFVLPRFRIAIDLRTNDLLLADVHQYHGNTEIIKKTKDAVRLSFVMYYRENMWKCGSPSEELRRHQLNQRRVAQEFVGLI